MGRIEIVTSAANPLLKEVRRAGGRGTLTSDGLWIAEGLHLFEEALQSEVQVPVVIAAESAAGAVEARAPGRIVSIPDQLFYELATTQSTQGVLSLVKPPVWTEEDVFAHDTPVVVLDGIQDPGNAGAIVRAAEGFGAAGIIFMKGAVGPNNPKTLRAAAGSLFRLPFITGLNAAAAIDALKWRGRAVYAAMPAGGSAGRLEATKLEQKCGVIVGSEGHGVSRELLEAAEGISISTSRVESLNAAMAATVLLYEAQRQR